MPKAPSVYVYDGILLKLNGCKNRKHEAEFQFQFDAMPSSTPPEPDGTRLRNIASK